jgi:ABC-type phosphate transport system substrate-binding protein
MAGTPSQLGRNLLAMNEVDFTTTDSCANAADFLRTPDMISIPTAAQALVFGYNLPGVSATLVLTTNVALRIFMGNITMWNDAALTALNPAASLPALPITLVVRGDPQAMNAMLNTAFTALSPFWKTTNIYTPAQFVWQNISKVINTYNFLENGNVISTVPYTITYMWYAFSTHTCHILWNGTNKICPLYDMMWYGMIGKMRPVYLVYQWPISRMPLVLS